MQLPFDYLLPKSDWRAPDLSELPADWNRFERVSIDTETRDEQLSTMGCGARRGAYITGYCLSFEGGGSFYLPVRHEGGGNMDPRAVHDYVASNARAFTGTLVGMNLGYDLDMLAEVGIDFPAAEWLRDVSVADPLINELQDAYTLEAISERHGVPGKDETVLLEALRAYAPKKTPPTRLKRYLWALPATFVGRYGEGDADRPLRILREQEKIIERDGLQRVFDLESRLLPALVRMRRRGVRVHQTRLAQINEWALKEEAAAWAEIKRLTGVSVAVGNAMKAKVLAPILDEIGVSYGFGGRKMDTPSIDKELLGSIDHPVGGLIRRARKMSQLRTTFVASVLQHMVNGRIHCTFNQLKRSREEGEDTEGVGPGRLSCVNPNMQQQPARDEEIGPMWRSIYLPEEGAGWGAKDYSQQEPRWLVALSCITPVGHPRGGPKSKWGQPLGISQRARDAALAAAQRYRENPLLDCYDDFSKTAKLTRKDTKEVYLGRCYGMGGPKMARKLKLPVVAGKNWKGQEVEVAGPEAQAKIDGFDAGVPYAREMSVMLTTLANERGYIRTHSGRRVHYPMFDGRYEDTQKGLNNEIQGSSADETKEAVVALDRAGYFIQLQVHDEVDGSYGSREEAEAAGEIMRNAIPDKAVPSRVDVEFGVSWGEAK